MLQSVDVDLPAVRDALRREREARVGSRAKLEKASGVAESTIYRIETENKYVPRVPVLLKLIKGLKMSPTEFFAGIEGVAAPAQRQETSGLAQDLYAVIDRVIAARVEAPTRATSPAADGATVTLTFSAPLEDWQLQSLREYGETLATGEVPEPAASTTQSPQAPTETTEKPA